MVVDCEVCDKTLSTQIALNRHVKNVHLGIKDPSKTDRLCPFCKHSFAGSQVLTRHLKKCKSALSVHGLDEIINEVASSTEKFTGTIDQESNKTKRKAVTIKTVVGGKPKRMRTATRVPAGERLFQCDKCDINFANKYLLIEHSKRFHNPQNEKSGGNGRRFRWEELYGLEPEASETDDESDFEALSTEEGEPTEVDSIIDPDSPTLGGLIKADSFEEHENEPFDAAHRELCFHMTKKAKRICTTQGRALELISKLLKFLVRRMTIDEAESTVIHVGIDSTALNFPVRDSLRQLRDFEVGFLLNEIERVMGSNTDFGVGDDLVLMVNIIRLPTDADGVSAGRVGGPLSYSACKNEADFAVRSTSTFDPQLYNPNDKNCFGRAVAAGMLGRKTDGDVTRKWWYKNPRASNELFNLSLELYQKSSTDPRISANLETYDKFQNLLNTPEYDGLQLVVHQKGATMKTLFEGKPERPEQDIIRIAIFNNHAHWVRNPRLFFEKRKECPKCHKMFNCIIENHTCFNFCRICQGEGCDAYRNRWKWVSRQRFRIPPKYCQECNRFFDGTTCFENHVKNGVCEKMEACSSCFKVVERHKLEEDGDHKAKCMKRSCRHCGESVPYEHLCHVQQVAEEELTPPDGKFKYIIFDTEAFFSGNRHEPYCIVADTVCENCIAIFDLVKCLKCGTRRQEFYGPAALVEFGDWLFFHPAHQHAIALSHNGSRYDNYHLLAYLLDNGHEPRVTASGGTIVQLEHNKVVLKDTYLFIARPLASLPAALGFKDPNIVKGYFPHRLAKTWNDLYYKGPMPHKKHFMTENMVEKEEQRFDNWLEPNENVEFDFEAMARGYCGNDVTMLRMTVYYLRELCLENGKIDPFYCCFTLAMMCSKIYRSQHMPKDTIGIVPPTGYVQGAKVQSLIATKYLEYRNILDDNIWRTAANGKEIVLDGVKGGVDAYCHEEKSALEVAGCYIHSCLDNVCDVGSKQLANVSHPWFTELTHREVHEKFMHKIKTLRDNGYSVEVIWEHDLKAMLVRDAQFKDFCDDKTSWAFHKNGKIDTRSALYGGRTEGFKLLRELSPKQIRESCRRIFHLDICSLYPTIMKKRDMPCGHPEILNGPSLPTNGNSFDVVECRKYFGVFSVSILPPSDLLLPILPYRTTDSKLKFGLCRTCMDNNNMTETCSHAEEERTLTGCYCSPELEMALRYGYMIAYVHQIWNYKEKRNDLFLSYINTWFKIKAENSKPPSDPEKYKADMKTLEQVDLDVEELKKPENLGKRTLSKLCLNSLWGKLAQRLGLSNTKYYADPEAFRSALLSKRHEVKQVFTRSPRVAMLVTKDKEDFIQSHSFFNPVVASFVTAWARVYLCETMQTLGKNLCYVDTDSVIFEWHPPMSIPQIGEYLGQWTNELDSSNGEFIKLFACLGAKTYSYVTNTGRTVVKAKGLQQRGVVKDLIEYNTFRQIIERQIDATSVDELYATIKDEDLRKRLIDNHHSRAATLNHMQFALVPDRQIVKDRSTGILTNDDLRVKIVSKTFDKRVVLSNNETVPYGWK